MRQFRTFPATRIPKRADVLSRTGGERNAMATHQSGDKRFGQSKHIVALLPKGEEAPPETDPNGGRDLPEKRPSRNQIPQISIHGGDHSHFDGNIPVPHSTNPSILQNREQLGLERKAKGRQFIEEQGTPLAASNRPIRALRASVNAPFSCPNNSDSARFSGWRTIGFHQRGRRPGTLIVNPSRNGSSFLFRSHPDQNGGGVVPAP